MEKTNITVEELKGMPVSEFISLCNKYPRKSQWENVDAFFHIEYRIAQMQSKRYEKTKDIKSLIQRPI